MAGATEERKLLGVGSSARFGEVSRQTSGLPPAHTVQGEAATTSYRIPGQEKRLHRRLLLARDYSYCIAAYILVNPLRLIVIVGHSGFHLWPRQVGHALEHLLDVECTRWLNDRADRCLSALQEKTDGRRGQRRGPHCSRTVLHPGRLIPSSTRRLPLQHLLSKICDKTIMAAHM